MMKAEDASSVYGKRLKDVGGTYDRCGCVRYSLGNESCDGELVNKGKGEEEEEEEKDPIPVELRSPGEDRREWRGEERERIGRHL